MPEPGLQVTEIASHTAEYILSIPVDDGCGILRDGTAYGDNIAANFGIGTQFHIPEHGNRSAANLAVYVGAAEYCYRRVTHRTRDSRITKNRHHRIRYVAVAGRGSEDRHQCIDALTLRQIRVVSNIGVITTIPVMFVCPLKDVVLIVGRDLQRRAGVL